MQLGEKVIDQEEVAPNRWKDIAYISSLKTLLLQRNELLLEVMDEDPIFYIERKFMPLTL